MTGAAVINVQGVQDQAVVVNPALFYQHTRRQRFAGVTRKKCNWSGGAESETLKQTGVVSALEVRIAGTVSVTGTLGTTTPSYNWPHLVKNFKLGANGQSTLYKARALTTRALELVGSSEYTDAGVSRAFGATTQTLGTLSLPIDDWGTTGANVITPGANMTSTGTYTYDMTYIIPIAADPVYLTAAIFAQSSATNLTLEAEYYNQAELFSAFGGSAVLDMSGLYWDVTEVVYSLPVVDGKMIVPDLTVFHQVSETFDSSFGQGLNEPTLKGTGTGRKLLRLLHNVYSSGVPLAVTDANFNSLGWAYGGNTVPETVAAGGKLRALNFRQTGCDIGRNWGFVLHDFVNQNALRDVVDLGNAANIRAQIGLANAPTTPQAYMTLETVFSGVAA